ncbi:MAG: nuclear transport factor 2 family protein [Gemmatimonadota bacterium]
MWCLAVAAAGPHTTEAQDAFADGLALELLGPSRIVEALTTGIGEARARATAEGDRWTSQRQQAFVEPFTRLIGPADASSDLLDPAESLSLGEFYFLTFRGDLARPRFLELAERGDLVGSHAADRLLAMAFATSADDRWSQLDAFERRFSPSIRQIHGRRNAMSFMLSRASRAEGDAARPAVRRLLDAVDALPMDAPYSLLQFPVQWESLVQQAGLEDEARRILSEKLVGLRQLEARWASGAWGDDLILTDAMPAWYWYAQGVHSGETFRDARIRQLDEVIAALEMWLGEPAGDRPAPSDEDEVRRVVGLYVEGVDTHDADLLRQAFHPQAQLQASLAGYWERPFSDWLAFTRAPVPDDVDQRSSEIVSIAVHGDAASATVRLEWPTVRYVDVLSLLRVDGSWRIVNKIWHQEARPAAG